MPSSTNVGNGQWPGLVRLVSIALMVLVSICLIKLALTEVLWVLNRWRPAELDAQRSEIDGDLRARIANLPRDTEPKPPLP